MAVDARWWCGRLKRALWDDGLSCSSKKSRVYDEELPCFDSYTPCSRRYAIGGTDCARFVLNATSLQLIPAYSSQSWDFSETLDFPRFSGHRYLSERPALRTPQG